MKKVSLVFRKLGFRKTFILLFLGLLFGFIVQSYTLVKTSISNPMQSIQRIVVTTNGMQSGTIVADVNTGGNIIFYTGNHILFATDNGNKRIGINTIAPTASLDVSGDARIRTIPYLSTDFSGILVVDNNGYVKMIMGGKILSGSSVVQFNDMGSLSGSSFLIRTGNRLGIGINVPNALFQVANYIDFLPFSLGVAFGYQAGNAIVDYSNISGNVAIGYQALKNTTTGYDLVALGYQTLYANSMGYNNIGIGSFALYQNTIGYNNIAIGYKSLYANILGKDNVVVGHQALPTSLSGHANVVLGNDVLVYTKSTSGTVVVGAYGLSGLDGIGNDYHLAVGYEALSSLSTGGSNVVIGYQAGKYLVSGSNNIMIGYMAGPSTPTEVNNTLYIHNTFGIPLIYGKFDTQQMGINTIFPTVTLEISGAVRVGNTSLCDNNLVGTIAYRKGDQSDGIMGCRFNGRLGEVYEWVNLTK